MLEDVLVRWYHIEGPILGKKRVGNYLSIELEM